MPVLTVNKDGENERSESSFIRLQNLPWSACRSDIREFFKGISIKKDGILIRDNEAFVALENPLDIDVALFQKGNLLHGSTVQLSVIGKDELQKALQRKVRRKLDFGQPEGDTKSHVIQSKKIRPTPVSKGQKRRALPSLTFLPEEIDLPPRPSTVDGGFQCINRVIREIKKVHPTRVSDTMSVENFAVFHPDVCYEVVKKIKLDVRLLCTFQA